PVVATAPFWIKCVASEPWRSWRKAKRRWPPSRSASASRTRGRSRAPFGDGPVSRRVHTASGARSGRPLWPMRFLLGDHRVVAHARNGARRSCEPKETTMKILTSPGRLLACALAVGALVSACSSIGQPAVAQPTPAVSPNESDAGSSHDLGLSTGRVGSGALAFPPDAARPLDAAIAADASLPADPNYLLLPFGVAETLVDGVTAAEDAMFSTDERLFVTGNDGVYELQRNPSGNLRATNLHPGEKCVFTG